METFMQEFKMHIQYLFEPNYNFYFKGPMLENRHVRVYTLLYYVWYKVCYQNKDRLHFIDFHINASLAPLTFPM